MGTRPGSIDPGVILYLFQNLELSAKEVETMLYKKSGLLAISGISNDMRDLLESEEPAARLAVDYFVYRAAKEIGALAAVLGGLDALVFTAGIGENSAEIRRRICEASAWLGIELDASANEARGARISRAGQPRVRLGDPDQRRTDDRPAHRRAARPRRDPRLTGCMTRRFTWLRPPRKDQISDGGPRPGRDSAGPLADARSTSATSSSRTTRPTTATNPFSRRPRHARKASGTR